MTAWLGTDALGLDRPRDLRLLVPAVATWLTALGAVQVQPWAAWVFAAAAGCGAAALLYTRGHLALTVAAVLVCSATVAAVAGVHVHRATGGVTARAAAQERTAEFQAEVVETARARAGTARPGRAEWVLRARTSRVREDGRTHAAHAEVVLLASGEGWRALLPGQSFRARGVFLPAEDDPLTSALVLVRGPPRETGPPSGLQTFAERVRSGLREAASGLPQPERGLLPALVVGDVSEVPEGTTEDFRATGMTHLLTVSGANLAVLTGLVLGLARWTGAPTWCAVAGGALMIWLFVLVCRPEPSVIRAAFMGSLGLLALAAGRPHAALGALGATVIGVLFVAPGLAASFGFALSVLATGGILLLVPSWSAAWARRMPVAVAEALAVAVAAQVAVAPVLVLLSGEVSWVAVPANVLAAPVVALVTVAGFGVTALAWFWPTGAAVAAYPPGWGVAWLAQVAHTGALVPHGAVPWRADATGALLLAALLLVLVVARGRVRLWLAAAVAVVLLAATAVRCVPDGWPPPRWAFAACDVGQGSAFVLSAGPGAAVVYDTGEEPEAVDGCLDRLGVREVPLLVLSHDHADHVDGVAGVLRHRRVGPALAPPGFAATPTGRDLVRAGVELVEAGRGQALSAGAWRLRVLWPPPAYTGSVNDRSLVVRADRGALSVLLTGDVEEDAQGRLLAGADSGLLPVTVLAVPHHGAGTQDPAFLEATAPAVTATSVGVGNRHGHPAPHTWRLLERIGRVNLRTDRDGDVAVVHGGGAVRAVARGPSPGR
ncbi:ComEC/Rec2 family competence protein [Nocardiopsis sp. LOL_012]|uniref:ComEC/Rec2 family competence protein n=1 Tax=Nocardiopsis sp. LOL_012 TaxID=3345409 RepID=UPI003A88106C